MMDALRLGDDLHRVIKMALDSGEVTSIAEAEQLFGGYQLCIEVGNNVAVSPTLQAALLTAVNTGRRCFLGGVRVAGNLDVDLLIPWLRCRTLSEAVIDLQGQVISIPVPAIPRIVIGEVDKTQGLGEFAVRATFEGWSGGIVPLNTFQCLAEQHEFIPAGVLAGALAVSEAFQFLRGNVQAGRREAGLSLWRLEEEVSWLKAETGPRLELLPARLWLIGLGHLGQAYLWTLGLLPYTQPETVRLVLQDYDTLVPANDSTSLLTRGTILGGKKTRAMAHWCEERGFRTVIQERQFTSNFTVADDEPHVALCGVDNKLARAALEDVGFNWILEAGLGRGIREYLAFQVHTFPAQRLARTQWNGVEEVSTLDAPTGQPAYQTLAAEGIDQCGLTMLAGRAVGASFVGAATAAILIAELLRMIAGAHRYEVIDGDLHSLSHRQAILSDIVLNPFNPGYTPANVTRNSLRGNR